MLKNGVKRLCTPSCALALRMRPKIKMDRLAGAAQQLFGGSVRRIEAGDFQRHEWIFMVLQRLLQALDGGLGWRARWIRAR
jgi:hypothetical protein